MHDFLYMCRLGTNKGVRAPLRLRTAHTKRWGERIQTGQTRDARMSRTAQSRVNCKQKQSATSWDLTIHGDRRKRRHSL